MRLRTRLTTHIVFRRRDWVHVRPRSSRTETYFAIRDLATANWRTTALVRTRCLDVGAIGAWAVNRILHEVPR